MDGLQNYGGQNFQEMWSHPDYFFFNSFVNFHPKLLSTFCAAQCEISRQERIKNEPAVGASLLRTKKGRREGAGKRDGETTYLSLSAARCRSAMTSTYKQRER